MTEFIKENRRRIESISGDITTDIPSDSTQSINLSTQNYTLRTDTTIKINDDTIKKINAKRTTKYVIDLIINDILQNNSINDTPVATLIGSGSKSNRREVQEIDQEIDEDDLKEKDTVVNIQDDKITVTTDVVVDTDDNKLEENITEMAIRSTGNNYLQYLNESDLNINVYENN